MKHLTLAVLLGAALSAQSADTIESHVAAAKALNATDPTCSDQPLHARPGIARHASGAARRPATGRSEAGSAAGAGNSRSIAAGRASR